MVGDREEDKALALNCYMHWYRSRASLHLLKALTDPLKSYYARASEEKALSSSSLD